MTPSTRNAAQQRADQVRVFHLELDRLDSEGVLRLTEEQKKSVDAHHETLLNQLAQSFDPQAEVLQQVIVRPPKSGILLQQMGVLWIPF